MANRGRGGNESALGSHPRPRWGRQGVHEQTEEQRGVRERPPTGQQRCWGRAWTRRSLTQAVTATSSMTRREREGGRGVAQTGSHASGQRSQPQQCGYDGAAAAALRADRAGQTCYAGRPRVVTALTQRASPKTCRARILKRLLQLNQLEHFATTWTMLRRVL
jgi:hypothetical protein